jgi:phage N-6-adenine-methyltransferase
VSKTITRAAAVDGVERESDLWRTERACFEALHDEFGFDVDLAADASNHLLPTWMGPGAEDSDALKVAWGSRWRRGYVNPPYSQGSIARFLERAIAEASLRRFTTVALIPDTHDTGWYRLLDAAAEIRRIPHRVKYVKADGRTLAGAMFPSCVAVFRYQPGIRDPRPRIVEWTYRKHEGGEKERTR